MNSPQTKFTIYFTKRFTSGTLKGISVIQQVSCPTVERCAKVGRIGREGKDVITGAKWVITDSSFQNYRR